VNPLLECVYPRLESQKVFWDGGRENATGCPASARAFGTELRDLAGAPASSASTIYQRLQRQVRGRPRTESERLSALQGEYLYSPLLTDEQMDWIDTNPVIVEPVIEARRNAAGFYTRFPCAIQEIFERTLVLSIDIETTALTRYAPAIKLGKSSQIGSRSLSSYIAQYPDTTIDTRPGCVCWRSRQSVGRAPATSFSISMP
jgi:hypothetical protein